MKEFKSAHFEYTMEEVEDGYVIKVKGDKEKIKAKIDAIHAFFDFKKKAKKAGMIPEKGHCRTKIMTHVHEHFKRAHKGHCDCKTNPESK